MFTEWGKPVAFQLIHDTGLELYTQTLSARTAELDSLAPCLEEFVPIVQQAAVDFVADPDRANAIIIDAVEKYQDFWVYEKALADYSVETQVELGLVGNGPDATLGNFELDRVQEVIDKMRNAGMDVNPDLTAEDLVTNEFVDPTIGL